MELCPITLKHGGRTHRKVKAIVDGGVTTFYRWDHRDQKAVVIMTVEGVPVKERQQGQNEHYSVGDVPFVKHCGCTGCGRLKGWRPDGGPPRVATKPKP